MRSTVAYTGEIDDLDAAAAELLAQVKGFELGQNSLAVLFTEEDTDYPELYRRLAGHWDFPVMGCTAMAMLTGAGGYCRGGITVLLLTADDCRFSVGITDELDGKSYAGEITRLYGELAAKHDGGIKLGLSYFGMPVDDPELQGGNLLAVLNDASKGLPIYGGAASDNLSFAGYSVFFNERVVKNALVLALISGNVSPRFVRINSVEHTASFSYQITRSEGNTVYRLGEYSLVEALEREHMRVDRENMMAAYILSPFLITIDRGGGDKTTVARILSTLDLKEGSGSFQGVMPEGATLSIGVLSREDVCRTVEEAFSRIFSELEREKGGCATLLCSSCGARYLALINDPTAEAKTYLGRLPEGVSLAGLYPYGECCPVQGKKSGRLYNTFHNFTFTILAI